MKTRRHHNNAGLRQIRRGRTRDQVAAMAARLGVSINQCDGCRRGMPIRGSIHFNPDGSYDLIACSAGRYSPRP